MVEPRHTPSPKVTLEKLIQLKRAERPPRAFWEDFDRELHRRQLAALVTVEPWYRRLGRGLASVSRRVAPLGAGVAALAFAVVAVMRDAPADETVASATVAALDTETRVVLLPEEAISMADQTGSTVPAAVAAEEFRGDVRSAPQEFAAGLASARRFVAVSAPVTFSNSSEDASAIYAARALTAGAVLRTMAAAAPESL